MIKTAYLSTCRWGRKLSMLLYWDVKPTVLANGPEYRVWQNPSAGPVCRTSLPSCVCTDVCSGSTVSTSSPLFVVRKHCFRAWEASEYGWPGHTHPLPAAEASFERDWEGNHAGDVSCWHVTSFASGWSWVSCVDALPIFELISNKYLCSSSTEPQKTQSWHPPSSHMALSDRYYYVSCMWGSQCVPTDTIMCYVCGGLSVCHLWNKSFQHEKSS